MLRELRIQHFGPFDHVEWALHPGWTVLTGETGAGKSLLVEAMQCLAGEKLQSRWIAVDHPWSEVEGVFELPDHPELRQRLVDLGVLDDTDGGSLIVRRRLYADGRQKVWIQGRRASLRTLRTVMRTLVDILDQWSMATMLTETHQRTWLDAFAGLETPLAELRQTARRLRRLLRKRKEAGDVRVLEHHLQRMRHEWKELCSARLEPGREDELNRLLQIQSRTMHLLESVQTLLALLQEDDPALSDRVQDARRHVQAIVESFPELREHLDVLDRWQTELEALVYDLVRIRERLDWDPEEWQTVESEVRHIEDLKRKYRMRYDELIAYRDRLAEEIPRLERQIEERRRLEDQIRQTYRQYLAQARAVHARRVEAARRLEEILQAQLPELALGDGRLTIHVDMRPADSDPVPAHIQDHGLDRVEFRFQAHPHLPEQPLADAASGGEVARIILAVKSTVGQSGWPRTLIFDEIDMGIGGEALEAVGTRLRAIAAFDQVITVTHWPQLAAMADHHWVVEKITDGDRVVMQLRALQPAERVQELVRMLGGRRVAPTVQEHAAALLQHFQTTGRTRAVHQRGK